MKVFARIEKIIVPPGKYILGDPCYCFTTETQGHWNRFLNSNTCYDDSNAVCGQVKIQEADGAEEIWSAFGFRTAQGDGSYTDQYYHEYYVDSGLIGLVPYGLAEKLGDVPTDGVRVVEFTKPAECFERAGVLSFGGFVIDTESVKLDDWEYDDE